MPVCIIRFIAVLILLSSVCFSQEWEWTKKIAGPSVDKVTGVAVDGTGNLFITGYFDSTITFDSITLVSAGGTDIFLAKYDGDGILIWAKQVGGQSDDYASGISTDLAGNCYITGYFFIQANVTTFGSTTITETGDADIFVSKFNASGKLLWVRNAGGKSDDASFSISTDLSGNCYIAGYITGVAMFGNIKLTSVGYSDVFLAKYDAAGNLLWAKQAGGAYQDEALSVSTDVAGNCYITGYFTGSMFFGNHLLTSAGYFDTDVFIAKYNPSGTLVWAKRSGGTGNDAAYGIQVMPNGTFFICGSFRGTKSYGENVLIRAFGSNGFVAKFDAAGKMIWSRNTNGSELNEFKKISADSEGNCYVAGYISGTVLFGSISLTSSGNKDACVAKYDSKGSLMWVLQGGENNDDETTALSADAAGNCFAGGTFIENISLGRFKLSGEKLQDIFISRIK